MEKLAPNRKDFSAFIGQTFGELTILSSRRTLAMMAVIVEVAIAGVLVG